MGLAKVTGQGEVGYEVVVGTEVVVGAEVIMGVLVGAADVVGLGLVGVIEAEDVVVEVSVVGAEEVGFDASEVAGFKSSPLSVTL